jgi:3-oxoadipate enol-lactonase
VKLAYVLDGDERAPVLVLSGGLGTTTRMWDAQVDALAPRFRVLRVDHPGHGASPVSTEPVTVEGIARGVLAVLDGLGVERVAFCGLSLGGMVGQWLGANAADRLDALVLACTAASLGARDQYRERAELVRRDGVGNLVDGAGERWFTPPFRETQAARNILDELQTMSPEGYAACCEAVGEFDFRDDVTRIEPDTLVIVGEEDSVTTPAALAPLQEIPRVRRVDVAHAAHLANVEQPEAFSAAVLAHLQERKAA